MQTNDNVSVLLWHMSNLFEAHQAQCQDGDVAAYEALHALGYFAGCIIGQAQDQETRQRAHGVFVQAMEDALKASRATKH